MTAFYRNRETGIVQAHPKSGIGESLNADEIEDTGRPVKPRTSKAPTKAELKRKTDLLKDNSVDPKTTGATSTGKQEGAE